MIINSQEIKKNSLLITIEVKSVDLNLGNKLRKEFMAELKKKYPFIIIDLGKVQFLDSAGLGVLVLCWQEASKYNGKVLFVSLSSSLKKLFSITKIDQFVEIFDTKDEALKKC